MAVLQDKTDQPLYPGEDFVIRGTVTGVDDLADYTISYTLESWPDRSVSLSGSGTAATPAVNQFEIWITDTESATLAPGLYRVWVVAANWEKQTLTAYVEIALQARASS